MKLKRVMFILQTAAGIILLLVGSFVLTSDKVKMASGLCIGFGAAVLVLGIGWFIQSLIISATEDEEFKRTKAIEVNDERNTRIREKTGYMVAKIMNYVLLLFILTLGFMGVDKLIIIMAVTLIIFEFVLALIFSNYFAKRM